MKECKVVVVWQSGPVAGDVCVTHGTIGGLRILSGFGEVKDDRFSFSSEEACELEITVGDPAVEAGPRQTRISVLAASNPFTFFLRDVTSEYPIFIPAYGVAVKPADDPRSWREIEATVRAGGRLTNLQRIESAPEADYARAAAETRVLRCPTWLGLSRDMRIFEFDPRRQGGNSLDSVRPRFHGREVALPECDDKAVSYGFLLGRGWSGVDDLTRELEDGVLPIVNGRIVDEDVSYNFTAFVTLEKTALTAANLRGTHYLVSDGHGAGHMFTPGQQAEFDALLPGEMARDEETVFCFRAKALNTAAVPRYAWFLALSPLAVPAAKWSIDPAGFGVFADSERVFAVMRLNGRPMPSKEVSVLVKPGESATFEFLLPHRPIPRERADALAALDFEAKRTQCRAFWQDKLAAGARVHLPEKRVDEMAAAGLLHLDVIAYGLEPDGPLTANIGVYCPIGSESSPIIQFLDAMGWHAVARRALAYFLEKQHDDGFIQNFGGYMLETGPALWSMGEHYRYTRDDAWVKSIEPKLLKACEFMINWRRESMREEHRGKGYGLQAGKVADPEDPFHSFMLNGYAFLGLSRVAEMLARVNPAESARLAREAEAFRTDIRTALFESMAVSPVVPVGDGAWVPTCAPWTEYPGPVSLFAEGGQCYTHGTFTARDSMLGPIYLIFQEVLEPDEPAADFIMNWHAELMCVRNVAFSQPYYARQTVLNLRRREMKAFIKAYYYGFSGLADRQTYTFWEHYFHASPHKTHEEGWFLMQTRWMLWLEQADTLRLLPGIPRAWLEHGKTIELDQVATYFGPVSLKVCSRVQQGVIEAAVACTSDRQPARIALRLPHPDGAHAVSVEGGKYCPGTETVYIDNFKDSASITLRF